MERNKLCGLLESLPVSERPWKSVSLDFIASLPKVREIDSVLMVVDRFWGVPLNIVSDRDPRFLGN